MSALFSKVRNAIEIFKSTDLDELSKICGKVDLLKMTAVTREKAASK